MVHIFHNLRSYQVSSILGHHYPSHRFLHLDLDFNPFPLSSLSLPKTLPTQSSSLYLQLSSSLCLRLCCVCVCVLVPPKKWWAFHLRSFFSFPHNIMPHSCVNPNRAIEYGDGSTSSIVEDHYTSHRCVCVPSTVSSSASLDLFWRRTYGGRLSPSLIPSPALAKTWHANRGVVLVLVSVMKLSYGNVHAIVPMQTKNIITKDLSRRL